MPDIVGFNPHNYHADLSVHHQFEQFIGGIADTESVGDLVIWQGQGAIAFEKFLEDSQACHEILQASQECLRCIII